MRAWMVRAGSDAKRERVALSEGRVLAGWPGLGNLAGATSISQIRDRLHAAYGEDLKTRTVGSWAGQLWRFVSVMSEGDIVVMPSKIEAPASVFLGRITGEYAFDETAPEGCQHYHPVSWAHDPVARDSLGPDLRASLGALTTICELSRNDAPQRLTGVLDGDDDPQAPPAGESAVEGYLDSITQQIEEGQTPRSTARDLLGRFSFYRRTAGSIETVTDTLSQYGLLTVPPLTEGAIDDEIRFVVDPGAAADAPTTTLPETDAQTREVSSEDVTLAQRSSDEVASGEIRYAVSSLPSARCTMLTAAPEESLSAAMTQMALNAYSQLPVIGDHERLIGVVTWESIAMAWAAGNTSVVRDAMVPAQSVAASEELLSLTGRIYDYGYVFVLDASGRVQGIVTAADLTKKFGDDHAPIIQLDEIEKRLGRHISEHCTDDDLRKYGVRFSSAGKTMGNYVTALNNPDLWEQLGWRGVDRVMFHAIMEKVRRIRNDIMHFSPDPVSSDELATLASAMRTLRMITADPCQ